MEYLKINKDLTITDEFDKTIHIGQPFLDGLKITMEDALEIPLIQDIIDEQNCISKECEFEIDLLERELSLREDRIDDLLEKINELEDKIENLQEKSVFKLPDNLFKFKS